MTSPSIPFGTDEHPEVEEISALTEGQLDAERSSVLRAHLAGCPLCADVRASLDEIRGLLGSVPGPARMPEDVAQRIDAALAAEALLNAAASHEATDGSDGTVSRETETASDFVAPAGRSSGHVAARGDVSRETGRRSASRPPGRSHATTGPGRNRAPRRWRTTLLAAAGAMAALGLGAVIVQGVSGGSSDSSQTADGGSPPKNSSGDNQESGTDALGKQVRALVNESDFAPGSSSAPKAETNPTPGEGTPLRGDGATTVPSCVREGIGRAEAPLAVDPAARYKGGAAYLVVLPHSGDSRYVDAYVVDPGCVSASAEGKPGEVLTKHTYARD
ncbi:anti-sigma factor family protein [Streptomyces sp. NPDC054784]